MRRVYVSGPYTAPTKEGVVENVNTAISVGQFLDDLDVDAVVPHLFHYWDARYPADYDRWMKKCLSLLETCDAMYVIAQSPGVKTEYDFARKLGIPVFTRLDEVAIWDSRHRIVGVG